MICARSLRNVACTGLVLCLAWASQGCNRFGRGSSVEAQETYVHGQQLAQNASFEDGGPVPSGWTWDNKQSGNKGIVSLDHSQHHSGASSLKLQPNRNNAAESPLAITQIIPAGSLRGQKVEFSGFLRDEGDTQAILGVLALVRGAPQGKPDMLFQNADTSGEWVQQRKVFKVPDDASVQLVLICMSNGKSGASWFDDVSVEPLVVDGTRSGTTPGKQVDTTPLTARIRVDNTVLRAGEQNSVVRIRQSATAPEIPARFRIALRHLTFRGCYCSVLDRCWTSDLSSTQVTEVRECPAPEHPFDPLGN